MTASNPYSLTHNPSSPVSRLPPELLVRTFKYLATRSSPTILLRICHRWADIASSVSSLWSRIDFSTPPAPFLQRCTNRPIEVILSSSPVEPKFNQRMAAREVLLLYNDRIRKLVLDLPAGHLREIEPVLSAVFPILVDVSISVWPNHPGNPRMEDYLDWRPAINPLSPIRYLRLLLVHTPWVPGRFQNLVEFFLHDQRYPSFDPSMEIFLEILESSPQLTVLSVANAGPRLPLDTITLPPATRIAHLRNLQYLYLGQEDACDIGWMLIHLKIPISANVRIFVDPDADGQTTVPPELMFDLALPNHPGFPHLTNLRRCAYAVDFRPVCIITAPNFVFSIVWKGFMHRHFDCFMMPFLRRAMAAGEVQALTVIHDQPKQYNMSTLQWDQIFSTLHSLRKLRVGQTTGDLDLSIWALFQSPLSPALRNLRLSYLVFGNGPQGEEEGKKLVMKLVDHCAERSQRGCRLEHLVIEAPLNPPLNLASLLAPYVDHVEIGEDILNDVNDDVWTLEFGSRRMFNFLQACT